MITSFALRGLGEIRAEAAWEKSLQTLLPGSGSFTRRAYTGGDGTVQAVYESSNGCVVETACRGYVDEVRLLVGVRTDGRVTGLVVQQAYETPGLGGRILRDHEFLAQFLLTTGRAEVGVDIVPISGATVSSRAVGQCVNAAVAVVTGVDAPTQATPWGDGS